MDDTSRPTGLSPAEAETFRQLLIRYCATELDQFDLWKTMTPYGPVYITIGRYPNADPQQSPDGWDSIDDRSWDHGR